jgi:hypothetical protein
VLLNCNRVAHAHFQLSYRGTFSERGTSKSVNRDHSGNGLVLQDRTRCQSISSAFISKTQTSKTQTSTDRALLLMLSRLAAEKPTRGAMRSCDGCHHCYPRLLSPLDRDPGCLKSTAASRSITSRPATNPNASGILVGRSGDAESLTVTVQGCKS